ncbi:MAG: hypothetical protein ACOC42_00090 [Halobacteriota archaeon]
MHVSEPSSSGGQPPSVSRLVTLAIGFAGLTIGTFLAWQQPATAYEVSIYAATPTGYWVGAAVAFLAAAVVVVHGCRDRLAGLALVLGGLTTVSIVALPVIRGYRFYGLGDSLVHLGWARELRVGVREMLDLFYPAAHSTSILVAEAAGVPLERAMIVMMAVLTAVFVLFVPLSAHAVARSPRATVIAAFTGFMLLPFTNLSTALHFHTYSIATLYLPVVVYLLVRYLTSPIGQHFWFATINRWLVALLLAGVAQLLFHPQVMLNVVILVGAFVAVQLAVRHRRHRRFATLQPIYLVFVVFALVWWIWMMQFPEYLDRGPVYIAAVRDTLLGVAEPGETVQSQTDSILAIGASPAEVFVKIFLVPLAYSIAAVYAAIGVLIGRTNDTGEDTTPLVAHFTVGGVILLPFFLLHYAGDISHLFFRHVGFAFALVSVFGAIGFHMAIAHGWWPSAPRVDRPLAVGLLALALVLSILVMFPSPYIYNQTHHATDQSMTGYATTFEVSDPSIGISGIRTGPSREVLALTDGIENPRLDGLYGEGLADPETAQSSPYYLPVAQVDVEREVIAYRELRFSEGDFQALDDNRRIDRVMASGDYRVYLVRTTPD